MRLKEESIRTSRFPKFLRYLLSIMITTLNIGILRMTGEVTDKFNGITLFVIALFWQKAIE